MQATTSDDATVTIPGQAGIVEAKAARMAAAVRWHGAAEKKVRWLGARDLGKRLQTERLG